MSTEAEVTDALQTPLDQNAQSAEDARKMLAELEGEAGANKEAAVTEQTQTEETSDSKTNGTTTEQKEEPTTKENDDSSAQKKDDGNKSSERRRGDRFDRGGRGGRGGRGRGRGGRGDYSPRVTRNNIKSDLTTQEESDDPVAIRKQVSC
jgi:lupus La protein